MESMAKPDQTFPAIRKSGAPCATAQNEVRKRAIRAEGLDGYTVLSVRLRNAEFLDFSAQVEKLGLKNNRALRIAARRISGFLEVDEETQDELRRLTLMFGRIANAMSEISRVAKQTQSVDAAIFLHERKALGAEFARLEAQLQLLLNVAKRRQDGTRRLKAAGEDSQRGRNRSAAR
jgi:type IV secretion system T-DNA border endonuclease VirD1